ncbi:MAG: hypothetical protein IT423_20385 [Pirellulaceae bacterium]|nr:hypothetical protein [Pirellulaceae bacterium]
MRKGWLITKLPANPRATNGWYLRSPYNVACLVSIVLIGSGAAHLAWLMTTGADWHGPLSLRKPGLFGVSGGLTVCSLAWVMSRLKAAKGDPWLMHGISLALLVEIGLITVQYWRGVASHFNHATILDAFIERSMLGFILLTTVAIGYLTLRTRAALNGTPAEVFAIRAGMWLLFVSCLLGIGTTWLGNISLVATGSSELWGKAGVLKFPHGVALHAIQLLPLAVWIAERWRLPNAVSLVRWLAVSQILFLLFAIRQTMLGRERFDCDSLAAIILAATLLAAIVPALIGLRLRVAAPS